VARARDTLMAILDGKKVDRVQGDDDVETFSTRRPMSHGSTPSIHHAMA
jgi:hypothetical protein